MSEQMHKPTLRELETARRYVRLIGFIGSRLSAGRDADRCCLAAGYVEGWLSVAIERGEVRKPLRQSLRRSF